MTTWHQSDPAAAARRFRRHQCGAAGIEAAFVLPVLLACLLFVVEFGRALYAKVEFEYALHSATRLGMVQATSDSAKIAAEVKNRFVLLNPKYLSSVTVSTVKNADNTTTATLTATYKMQFLLPVTKERSVTFTRSVSYLKM